MSEAARILVALLALATIGVGLLVFGYAGRRGWRVSAAIGIFVMVLGTSLFPLVVLAS